LRARLRKAISRFGLRGGFVVARELGGGAGRRGTTSVWVSALQRTVTLRRGTSDAAVLWQVFVDREYAVPSMAHRGELQRRYEAMVAAGRRPVIIDCGANIGIASLWYRKEFPLAHIIAVEPEAGNYSSLCANLAPIADATPVHGAVWPVSTRLRIIDLGVPEWGYRVEEVAVAGDGNIRAFTIADLVAATPDDPLLVVKIDIEGAEAALFERNTGWVDRAELIVIELHDYMTPGSGTSRNLLRCLAKLDCDVLVSGESLFVMRCASAGSVVAEQVEKTEPVLKEA
jgi:FkbM family methyltransferase